MIYLKYFVIVILLLFLIADGEMRDILNMVWLTLTGLFVVFILIYHYLDGKGHFNPKKRNKED